MFHLIWEIFHLNVEPYNYLFKQQNGGCFKPYLDDAIHFPTKIVYNFMNDKSVGR